MRTISRYKSGIFDETDDFKKRYGDNRDGIILAQAARIEALESALSAILNASSIVDYPESANSVQLKHFAQYARDKAKEALNETKEN